MADQLVPIPLVTPGFKGLNKAQAASTELDPGWATELQNFVFDQSGRVAARNGWAKLTTVAVGSGAAITSMGEYVQANGTVNVVSVANAKIYSGTGTMTDVTGAVVLGSNNVQWLNFNNVMYGVVPGQVPVQWNGSGNFANITVASGSAPTGTCGASAFGRLWILDADGQTIKYCQLLDSTNWTGVGAGSVNMATVWTRGTDTVVGIAAAGSKLVVFGTRQIVIFADSQGATIGLNPTNIIVYDTVEGTGLAARDTVQSTGEGDLTFLAPSGVQSLQRLITSNKANPIAPLDPQIHDYFNGYFVNEVTLTVRSLYSPYNRFYVILLPLAKRAFCYDTRQHLQDGSLRVSEWNGLTWTACVNQKSGQVLFGEAGIVGQYGGYNDNTATFSTLYNSPYLSLNNQDPKSSFENHQKILKRFKAVLYFGGITSFVFQWATNFGTIGAQSTQFSLGGNLTEYGTAEYGTNGKYNVNNPPPSSGVTYAEYGGSAGLQVISGPLSGSGRWLQFGLLATINGSAFAIQQLDSYVKIGNMV
jgi:hypothetical protein